jgi:hypothetical protein
MSQTGPSKPTQPAGFISFGPDGSVRKVIEKLPTGHDDLEFAVVSKFVERMNELGREITLGDRGDGFPDYMATQGEETIGIELAEVTDPEIAMKRRVRRSYVAALEHRVQDMLPSLSGLSITFHDDYQFTSWPSAQSAKGRALLDRIEAAFRREAPALSQSLGERGFIACTLTLDPKASILVQRSARSTDASPEFVVNPTFPSAMNRHAELPRETIKKKLAKRYQASATYSLWLLVWSAEVVLAREEISMELARTLLADEKHAFDEVWYAYILPEERTLITQVWPTDSIT